ncbi:DUF6193 family natural product biosynthesis protein [Dactylosporangium siamense]|uniref:Uncharacterized protein n=1 Tax=Dactylosporangium siamense TaxID=685454 RepID=A0A919UFB1_9ACTN|nr:DUF6193 family natural product biosynthesis protein [Dactylosporangium siamense]GIG48478.1 hypothetical protein Dsi01nite_065190 [Dactylosporangium siamense]
MFEVDPGLYPDVAPAGSLAAALQVACAAAGVPLRPGPDPAPGWAGSGARVFNGSFLATVLLDLEERAFRMEFRDGATLVAHASTTELATVVAGLRAWILGTRLEELATVVPAVSQGAAAATHGRGSIVEHSWRRYLEAGPQHLLPLLAAAGREPQIRSLMPYQTNRGMVFHRTVGYPPSADNISVVVVDGGYQVEDWNGADLGTADADGAVALMVDALRARST